MHPYTDADVELTAQTLWDQCGTPSTRPTSVCFDDARAVLDALAAAGRLATHGRCGDHGPTILGSSTPICALTAQHAGWHRAEDGSEWTTRRLSPALEEHILAGADALVRRRTQAPSLSELTVEERGYWISDARAVLMAAGGVPAAVPPGRHVLAVADDGTWAVEHPASCAGIVHTPTGPAVVCVVQDLALEQLTDDLIPPPGRYEVEAGDLGDRLCILDRIGPGGDR